MDIVRILSEQAIENSCRVWISRKHNYSTWISIEQEKMISAFDDAINEANYLDCIWFEGNRNIPAVFKICEGGNFIEAIYRLLTFKKLIPPYDTSYFLIASDSLEKEISLELKKPVFRNFEPIIIPLSKLENHSYLVKQLG